MRKLPPKLVIFQSISLVLLAIDLLADLQEGVVIFHFLLELSIVLVMGFILSKYCMNHAEQVRIDSIRLERDLENMRNQAEHWKKEAGQYLNGMIQSIDNQFALWNFSPAEKQIALLLIKGYSIREISALRETSEKTIKQQNFSIYKKSNLAGRSELAAFFLEDLLLPHNPMPK